MERRKKALGMNVKELKTDDLGSFVGWLFSLAQNRRRALGPRLNYALGLCITLKSLAYTSCKPMEGKAISFGSPQKHVEIDFLARNRASGNSIFLLEKKKKLNWATCYMTTYIFHRSGDLVFFFCKRPPSTRTQPDERELFAKKHSHALRLEFVTCLRIKLRYLPSRKLQFAIWWFVFVERKSFGADNGSDDSQSSFCGCVSIFEAASQ